MDQLEIRLTLAKIEIGIEIEVSRGLAIVQCLACVANQVIGFSIIIC